MKRILILCSALAVVASFALAGQRTYAAHPAAKMIQVRLCTSTPIGVPALKNLSLGIRHGVQLAVSQWKSRLKAVGIQLMPQVNYDYAKSDGSGYSTDKERQNGLACLQQSTTIAYIGTLNSGAALVSEPILNRGAMAMISPANTNTDLTNPSKRNSQEPATASGKISTITYFRTVTTDALQGPAGAKYVHDVLHKSTYVLVDDKLQYGAGLAAAFDKYASAHGMKKVGTGHVDSSDAASIASSTSAIADTVRAQKPDVVYCGCDSETTPNFVKILKSRGFAGSVFGGDALVNQDWVTNNGATVNGSYATSVGPPPTGASKNFQAAYKKMFGGFAIQAYDATSYDAASVALQAIKRAKQAGTLKGGKFNMRLAVAKQVTKARWFGATGVTAFDGNGDTKNQIISVYQVADNTWKFKSTTRVTGIKPTG